MEKPRLSPFYPLGRICVNSVLPENLPSHWHKKRLMITGSWGCCHVLSLAMVTLSPCPHSRRTRTAHWPGVHTASGLRFFTELCLHLLMITSDSRSTLNTLSTCLYSQSPPTHYILPTVSSLPRASSLHSQSPFGFDMAPSTYTCSVLCFPENNLETSLQEVEAFPKDRAIPPPPASSFIPQARRRAKQYNLISPRGPSRT